IPTILGFKAKLAEENDQGPFLVRELFRAIGGWDIQKLNILFGSEMTREILKILVNQHDSLDEWIWIHNPNASSRSNRHISKIK
ncbi:hypothetical protein TorRG33x02_352820, partial [Trema orientale]